MEKVARGNTPKPTLKDWSSMADALGDDIEGLRLLYSEAKTGGATTATLDKIKAIANGLASTKDSDSVNP
jgi:hypothetical protein